MAKKFKIKSASDVITAEDGSTISLNDIQSQVSALANNDTRFNQPPKGNATAKTGYCGSVWCCDVECDGDDWYAILSACDGKTYRVGIEVEDGAVTELSDDASEVVRKTQYVSASYHDMFFKGKLLVRAGGPGSGPHAGGGDEKAWVARHGQASYDAKKASENAKQAGDKAFSENSLKSHNMAADANRDAFLKHEEAADIKPKGSAVKSWHETMAKNHQSLAATHEKIAVAIKGGGEVKSSCEEFNLLSQELVKAADGMVEGKPTLHNRVDKMHKAVQKAIAKDPRFDTDRSSETNPANDYNKPYVMDVLVPDEDGKHHFVARTDKGALVKHGFNYDADKDTATVDDGDPKETSCTPVYTALLKEYDEVVKAAEKAKPATEEPVITAAGTSDGAVGGHATRKSAMAKAKTGEAETATAKANLTGAMEDHQAAKDAHIGAADAHTEAVRAQSKAKAENSVIQQHAEAMTKHDEMADDHQKMIEAAKAAKERGGVYDPEGSDGKGTVEPEGKEVTAKASEQAKENVVTAGGPGSGPHKVGDMVKLTKPGINGPVKIAGTVKRVLPEGKIEVKTQQDGYMTVHHSEAEGVKASTVTLATEKDLVHCRASGTQLTPKDWSLDKPARFMWMPSGVSTVSAGYSDRTIKLTVECDEDTAKTAKASFDQWRSELPKQKPFVCIEHREQESAGNPDNFEWQQDGEQGVYCSVMPSGLGVKNVNERIHRSFSPSFTTDAEYHKCVCADCSKKVSMCKCGGMLTFPDGVRGSENNPAKVTGVGFSVGSLTNKPAFKSIAAVKARAGGLPVEQKEPTREEKLATIFASLAKQASPPELKPIERAQTKENTMKVKIIKAHGEYKQVGVEVEVEASAAALLIEAGYGVDAVVAAREEKLTAQVKASHVARIKDAVVQAKASGAIAPKDVDIEAGLIKQLDDVPLDTMEKVATLVIETVKARRSADQESLEARQTARLNDDGNGYVVKGSRSIGGGYSLSGAAENYLKTSADMQNQIKGDDLKTAAKLSRERSVVMANDIISLYNKGENFSMRDLVKAADNVDPSVGTLATGLVLMRNLGFLKNKLSFLDKISTDLRNEPVAFGQNVLTRYITPPAVLTFVPGIGMTSDATTISNWKATITAANPAGTPQTSGTQTFSTAQATDISVVLNNYNGVEITFTNMTLASTMRNLFAEQQAAQFYSLAEYINQQFLIMLFKATWSGISTAPFSLCGNLNPVGTPSEPNPMGLANIIAIKNKFTMNKMPDNGRFALLNSAYHDAILTDSNMLTAKSILALIKKDNGAFEDGELPVLFGVKVLESQLAAANAGTLVTITNPNQIVGNAAQIGFAGNASSALFVARIPQDYTKVIPDIPATASLEIVTEPDSGLSMLVVKRVNNQIESTFVRAGLMFGFAQGDPRQGFILTP